MDPKSSHRAFRTACRIGAPLQKPPVASLLDSRALTATITHEVTQPLTGIIINAGTCLRMLAADPPDIEGARETARLTLRDGKRAADVVASLRVLFAGDKPVKALLDLNELTREVVSLLLSELKNNSVIPQLELAEQLLPVSGDRVQIQQVILNLISNALDSMKAVEGRRRQLFVRSRNDGDFVRLSIEDNGSGFAAHAADKLFEPFFTTKRKGMGIGLAVSRAIVEGHDGRIWATSGVGHGATFSFCIPANSMQGAAGDESLVPNRALHSLLLPTA